MTNRIDEDIKKKVQDICCHEDSFEDPDVLMDEIMEAIQAERDRSEAYRKYALSQLADNHLLRGCEELCSYAVLIEEVDAEAKRIMEGR